MPADVQSPLVAQDCCMRHSAVVRGMGVAFAGGLTDGWSGRLRTVTVELPSVATSIPSSGANLGTGEDIPGGAGSGPVGEQPAREVTMTNIAMPSATHPRSARLMPPSSCTTSCVCSFTALPLSIPSRLPCSIHRTPTEPPRRGRFGPPPTILHLLPRFLRDRDNGIRVRGRESRLACS